LRIGIIGLGRMGSGIAENIIRAGHDVTVWNRSPEPVLELTAKGATAAKFPEDALQGDVLISMLANDAAYKALGLDGPLLGGATKNLVHVNMATISVGFARTLAAAHKSRGLDYIAAPVFGRPDAAAEARLLIVAGGKAEIIGSLDWLFGAIGRRTLIVGDLAEQANLFKIAGNFMIASAIESMGEAFALLRKGGVDAALFHDVMSDTLFTGAVFQNYGKMIVLERYEPAGFALKLGLKDINLVRDAATEMNMTMPVTDLLREHFDEAINAGWGEKDWSALGGIIAKKAGL
jgi:3-hydroxyisobutyrate dehydrogenase-like beta-hydroxyacid dehydrogenase